MTLRTDLVAMPDLLVEQHVQVTHAQGAQAQLGRNMQAVGHRGDALGAGTRDQRAAQRQEDRQTLALAGHALVVRQAAFSGGNGKAAAAPWQRPRPCRALPFWKEPGVSQVAVGIFERECRNGFTREEP